MRCPHPRTAANAAIAPRPLIEPLENRRLLAGDPTAGFPLPFVLDFNRSKQGLTDRDGSGTGFTWAQPNKNGDEYQPRLIDLKIGAGILRLYTTGNADAGSNFDNDNTLVNPLTTTFAASSRPWVMSARVNGPPLQINEASEQGGILFGPDQDNYVKLVLSASGGKVGLQFVDEQKFKSGVRHYLPQTVYNIGSFSDIQTIDLYLAGDPTTGYVRALYRVNSGDVKQLPATLILKGDKRSAFFSPSAYGGVMAQHKNNGAGIDFTFDQFGIKRGVLAPTPVTTRGQITTASRRTFNDVRGGSGGQTIGVAVRNEGDGVLNVPANGLTLSGPDASMFTVSTTDGLPQAIQPGQSMSLKLTFTAPAGTALGVKTATLAIESDDPKTPVKNVALRGLATAGTGGELEPSLQRVLDLYQIPVNVGDSNPDDVFLNDPPTTPNDEVLLQQLRKAGSGDVVIQLLDVFGVASNPALRFGYYEPGTPAKNTELFTVSTADAQSVNPVAQGATAFDPGSAAFALYTVWPGFKNSDSSVRVTYQEDAFNTFDPSDKRHIRFYPMKNPDGSAVANAYVFAVEEIEAAKDNQDVVGVIYNVTSAAAGPEIGTENLDGLPTADRLAFNKFQTSDPLFPATTAHTQAKMRIRNSGSSALAISSIGVTGPFSVLSPTGAQTVGAGKFIDVLVQFNGSSTTGLKSGALTINSNDADEPAKVIALAGYHQRKPEGGFEPSLPQVGNTLFGFGTTFVSAGQNLNTGGKRQAVGDEVLSSYWRRANTSLPVSVRQLTSFHTQGEVAAFKWHNKGSNATNTVFTATGAEAQTLFPTTSSGAAAGGNFTPGNTAFGFAVDQEWSDSSKNPQEQPGGNYGHHIRFYPLRDANGALVANAYIMVMDYQGVNYDYNDNMYVISNIRPENS